MSSTSTPAPAIVSARVAAAATGTLLFSSGPILETIATAAKYVLQARADAKVELAALEKNHPIALVAIDLVQQTLKSVPAVATIEVGAEACWASIMGFAMILSHVNDAVAASPTAAPTTLAAVIAS